MSTFTAIRGPFNNFDLLYNVVSCPEITAGLWWRRTEGRLHAQQAAGDRSEGLLLQEGVVNHVQKGK